MDGFTKDVNVPILTANRLGVPEVAEKVVADGLADIVAIGRALLADPEFPNKCETGDVEDIRPCIGCHDGCLNNPVFHGRGLACSVNPNVGRELYTQLVPAMKPKQILVVGGGPAGMEFARRASLRGHEVSILEKASSLGGHLNEAGAPDFKDDIKRLLAWYQVQMKRLNITVRLNNEATASDLKDADAIVIATGSVPIIPDIPGIKGRTVETCEQVLVGKASTGNRVVVIGGGLEGCETALTLANQGKNVTIVEKLNDLMLLNQPFNTNRDYLINLLKDANVTIMTNVNVENISDKQAMGKELSVAITQNGETAQPKKQNITCDTVVLAVGLQPDDQLYQSLKGKTKELYKIGDCKAARKIHEAVFDGFTLANSI
jgi:2-enoate reductase